MRRLVHFVPVLFVVSLIAFTVTLLLPGDAALAMLGESNIHDKVAYETMRAELGLDQPIPVQYAKWLWRALQGDLGRSIRTGEPVLTGLLARLPVTLQLTAMVLILALFAGMPLGIVSALYPNSWADTAATVLAVGGAAVPDFWLGILFIYVFALWLRVVPPSGFVPLEAGLWSNFKSMLLPAMALGMYLTAITMRQIRSSLIEVMQQEYITTARAKGLREKVVVMRHALKIALIPVITVIGLQVGATVWRGRGRGDDLCAARAGPRGRKLYLLPRFPHVARRHAGNGGWRSCGESPHRPALCLSRPAHPLYVVTNSTDGPIWQIAP